MWDWDKIAKNSETFGYRLKQGTNAGKVLKHLKKTSDNI